MPELTRFYNIVIAMFYYDHNPPHVHVYYGRRGRPEWAAQVAIRDGTVTDGDIPALALRLVQEWIRLRQDELLGAWDRAVAGKPPGKIAPLRVR
jgi:hypothetical protein